MARYNSSKQEMKQIAFNVLQKQLQHMSFDTGFASTVDSTGTLQKLTTIPQGDTDSQRTGDKAHIINIEAIGTMVPADTTNTMRIIYFRWNQDDTSAAPVVADLLQTSTPSSPLNRDNERAKKFTIIEDIFLMACTSGPGICGFRFKKAFQSNIMFQIGANTGNGHIYMYVVSDSAASTHPALASVARVYYTSA
jgi:hypothetical protein